MAALLIASAAAGPTTAGQAVWTGRVVDAFNGEPVVGATLTPRDARWAPGRNELEGLPDEPRTLPGNPVGASVASAADGSFVVSDARASSLVLSAPGYLAGFVDLPSERGRELGTLTLEPATRLTGRLVTAAGEPAAGRRVALLSGNGAEDIGTHGDTTDPSGYFRLDGISLHGSSRQLVIEGVGSLLNLEDLPRRVSIRSPMAPIASRPPPPAGPGGAQESIRRSPS